MSQLFEFQCPFCKKNLVWTLAKSRVLCNKCGKWVKYDDLKNPKSQVVEDSEKSEQLKMFE